MTLTYINAVLEFLSTPSARRATKNLGRAIVRQFISIHALREEGDQFFFDRAKAVLNFYPRPPRGGRRGYDDEVLQIFRFLSTPSARRATA